MTRTEYNSALIGTKVKINRPHHDRGKIGVIRKKQYDEVYLEIVEDENKYKTNSTNRLMPVHYRMIKLIE